MNLDLSAIRVNRRQPPAEVRSERLMLALTPRNRQRLEEQVDRLSDGPRGAASTLAASLVEAGLDALEADE